MNKATFYSDDLSVLIPAQDEAPEQAANRRIRIEITQSINDDQIIKLDISVLDNRTGEPYVSEKGWRLHQFFAMHSIDACRGKVLACVAGEELPMYMVPAEVEIEADQDNAIRQYLPAIQMLLQEDIAEIFQSDPDDEV